MGIEEQDIQPMLDQMGVDAVSGGITARVVVKQISRALLPAEARPVTGRVVMLLMKTGAFPVVTGTGIVIATTHLKAHFIRAIQDGSVTEVYCQVV